MADLASASDPSSSSSSLIFAVTVAVALCASYFISHLLRSISSPWGTYQIIPSPQVTFLPGISPQARLALPYPPDLMPGARDVSTPFGKMRVYEWGPENGKKIVFVHGDSTPSPVFRPVADALVKKGCRVILFDLWGRGYSDSPLNVNHDSRLFGMQILFATASSDLAWTGSKKFSIIGFSLGGSITMSFAAHFPYLVESIVLLAPGGILRQLPDGYHSPILKHPVLIPPSYLRKRVADLLGVRQSSSSSRLDSMKRYGQGETPPKTNQQTSMSVKKPLDIDEIVQWQFDHHNGFVYSFCNTVKHGPYMQQGSDWQKTCNLLKGDTTQTTQAEQSSRLFNSRILMVFGDDDNVISKDEIVPDLTKMMGGPQHLVCRNVPGSHGFPVPSSVEVVAHIAQFWGLDN